jgi:ribulose-phosphate 3-epimerase
MDEYTLDQKIVPGILTDTIRDIEVCVSLVRDTSKLVQLDICDGKYTAHSTWPYSGKNIQEYEDILMQDDGLPFWESVNYELDLMVENAHTLFFSDWIQLGPSNIIFHLDAEHPQSLLEFFQNLDPFYFETMKIGIAINTDTDVEKLAPFIEYINFVQCMGIDHIGMQGEQFSDKAIEQIKKVRELAPNIDITIDGGITRNVLKKLKEYNLARFVVGSTIFTSADAEETIRELEQILN